MKKDEIKKSVRKGYGKIAKQEGSCCAPGTTVCGEAPLADEYDQEIGYTPGELASVPEGANLGLGCGNPVALVSLKEGETVLDLGSGAGLDCFLAAHEVGKAGRVIGVDMTPEMVDRARRNAEKGSYENVEFRLGEIENLPLADQSVDVVISNCVINLSPEKERVFQEAYRVLKPGGRMMVSDMALTRPLPESLKTSIEAYIGCVSGAMLRDGYLRAIEAAGFRDVKIVDEIPFPFEVLSSDPTAKTILEEEGLSEQEAMDLAASVVSLKVQGYKR